PPSHHARKIPPRFVAVVRDVVTNHANLVEPRAVIPTSGAERLCSCQYMLDIGNNLARLVPLQNAFRPCTAQSPHTVQGVINRAGRVRDRWSSTVTVLSAGGLEGVERLERNHFSKKHAVVLIKCRDVLTQCT